MYCVDSIVEGEKADLDDCKQYCKTAGSTRLTYYETYLDYWCICCTTSSKLAKSNAYNETKIYGIKGTCKYQFLQLILQFIM